MLQLSFGEFDLMEVIGDALEIIRTDAVLSEVFVDFDIPKETHRRYEGDYMYLTKMTSNLFRDAIERMSYGMATLAIEERPEEGKLVVSMRDTGESVSGEVVNELLNQYEEIHYSIHTVKGVGSVCSFEIAATAVGDECLEDLEKLLGQLKMRKRIIMRKNILINNKIEVPRDPDAIIEEEKTAAAGIHTQPVVPQQDVYIPPEPEMPDMSSLPEIPDINWDYAYTLTQDNDISLMTAQSFYRSIDKEINDIGMLYEGVDNPEGLNSYRIRVHGMKSAAASFGAMQISALCKMCEFAAKDGNVERIHALQPVLMEELHKIKKNWAALLPEEDGKPKCEDKNFIIKQLDAIRDSMMVLDIDVADEAIAQLLEYSYEQPVSDYVNELSSAVSNLDDEQCAKICDQIQLLIED